MTDWPHTITIYQRRKHTLHDFAIGEHIRNTTGHTQIILQHRKLPVGKPHQICSHNGNIAIMQHMPATHLTTEMLTAIDKRARNNSIGENMLLVIDIFEKKIQ